MTTATTRLVADWQHRQPMPRQAGSENPVHISPGLPGLYWAAAAFLTAAVFHLAHRAANAIATAGCPCCEAGQ